MNRDVFFTPGPGELYFTVPDHLRKAVSDKVASISHRSSEFKDIYAQTVTKLRELLSLPDNYDILFASSANEVWERIIQNCVAENSTHLVNGAFSGKFAKFAGDLGKTVNRIEAEEGSCVKPSEIQQHDTEMIAFTQNETSTGAAQPLEDIYEIRSRFPDPLLTVDMVSSLPFVLPDFNQIDSAYFSVQKCFGLPSGLGVWLANNRCVDRFNDLNKKNLSRGTYHRLDNWITMARKNQTPETPNVLNIYLLGKVIEDFLRKGLDQIRREAEYKAAVIYQAVEDHPLLECFVEAPRYRSKTVIVIKTLFPSSQLIDHLKANHMVAGTGYGKYKDEHIRIANFPTHSKEAFEQLADLIMAFKPN